MPRFLSRKYALWVLAPCGAFLLALVAYSVTDPFAWVLVRDAWGASFSLKPSAFTILSLCVALAGLLIHWLHKGVEAMKEQLKKFLFTVAYPAAVVFFFIFLGNLLFVVPYRIIHASNQPMSLVNLGIPPAPPSPGTRGGDPDPSCKSGKAYIVGVICVPLAVPSPVVTIRHSMVATATADVIARLYVRGPKPNVGDAAVTLTPTLQELFYEWSLSIVPNVQASSVTVTIRDSKPLTDRIRVTPDDGITISESVPKWLSGFNEPRTPDYYLRTVVLAGVSTLGAVIKLRRPFKLTRGSNNISEADFSRSFQVRSPGYAVEMKDLDFHAEAPRILSHFGTLGMWKYSGPDRPPPKTIMDPDTPLPPLAPGEVEATIEAHCKDAECKQVIMGQLEARAPR